MAPSTTIESERVQNRFASSDRKIRIHFLQDQPLDRGKLKGIRSCGTFVHKLGLDGDGDIDFVCFQFAKIGYFLQHVREIKWRAFLIIRNSYYEYKCFKIEGYKKFNLQTTILTGIEQGFNSKYRKFGKDRQISPIISIVSEMSAVLR